MLEQLMGLANLWLATEPAPSTSGLSLSGLIGPILSTGLVGIILIMLTFEIGFITKKSRDREVAASEASRLAEIKAKDDQIESLKSEVVDMKLANGTLTQLVQEKMIPAIVQSTDVGRAYVAELARRNDRLDEDRRGRHDS